MFSHDRYFQSLRQRIVNIVDPDRSSDILNFLSDLEHWKAGKLYFKLLSASRYSFPLFSIVASIFLYFYFIVIYQIPLNLMGVMLAVVNLALFPLTINSFFKVQKIFLRGVDS